MPSAPMIQIARPSLGDEEWRALREPLQSGWITQGPKVEAFEKAFARRHDVPHAIATTSCTTALHLALTAIGIGARDEVIVPAFTWVATANVVLYCGATPILADVDPQTFNMNIEHALSRVSERTRAIIPVHLFGLCADIDALTSALPPHVKIIEDAACAAGASYRGRSAGSLGHAAAFSFHPRKSITTGEGGMLTTCDEELASLAGSLRNHGASVSEEHRHHGARPYILPDFNLLGFNYRMTDLQGALGLVQLGKLDRFIEERARWAAWYRDALADVGWLTLPKEPEDGRHAWQAFVAYVDPERAPMPRDDIMDSLQVSGVSTRPGTHALHTLDLYRERFGFRAEDFPVARECERSTIALPLHNCMAEADYARVAVAIRSIDRQKPVACTGNED